MTEHALLSASSAERWLNCPGSVRLTQDMPDKTSSYAEEGRLAHSIAELKLRKLFLEPMGPKAFTTRMNKLKKQELYAAEMQGHTDVYTDYISEIANSFPSRPLVAAEMRVDFSEIVPNGFGTADCIMLQGSEMYIVDFKYGKGVAVSAEDNPQMKLYAFGALCHYRMIYDIKTIHITIVQPRAGGIKESVISSEDLCNWMAFTVKPAAQKAFDGVEEYAAGDWCRFCKAHAQCRESSTVISAVEDFGGKLPPLLSDIEVGHLLGKLDALKKYSQKVKDYAEATMLNGGDIPGWKLVEGRSSRAFDDQEAAFKELSEAGINEALLWHRDPYTLPQIETAVGKKEFTKIVGGRVLKQQGKPTVAPVSDKRKAYSTVQVEEDFKPIN